MSRGSAKKLSELKTSPSHATREDSLQQSPLRLSDDELEIVMRLAGPIARDRRDAYLQCVADALRSHRDVIGDGTVYAICREKQHLHLDPPILEGQSGGRPHSGKYA
jgi:hypothetical protein